MGRRKLSGEKQEKKTPTKIRMIARKHKGQITEPWRIMEDLISTKPCFEELQVCKPRLVWVKDWKADVDGIATGAQVCKASELDRNLAEESSGETVDVFIKLPEGEWPTLDEIEKRHRIFHELCHVRPSKNSEGHQKRDSKDRLLWRMRRHPITAFPEEIDEFGIERVLGHNARIVASISHAERPMEKVFDEAEAKAICKPVDWRSVPVTQLNVIPSIHERLTEAGYDTLGKLVDLMHDETEWWFKRIKRLGEVGASKVADAIAAYWESHPDQAKAAS